MVLPGPATHFISLPISDPALISQLAEVPCQPTLVAGLGLRTRRCLVLRYRVLLPGAGGRRERKPVVHASDIWHFGGSNARADEGDLGANDARGGMNARG
eukprot:3492812-Rhodomonas_salina.1